MFLRSFKLFIATLMAAYLALACSNGEPAAAPTGLAVSAGESSATITWDMKEGVEYWLFFGPSAYAPSSTASMQAWFGLPGGNVILKVTSPYVLTGLPNDVNYSFSINGRIDAGPGGPGAAPVTTSTRLAGAHWTAGPTDVVGNAVLRSVVWGTLTSTDGLTMTPMYVAAGDAGAVFSSTDGTTWKALNYASSSKLNGAAYFGSFKLVGDAGLVLTSPDAVNWTAQTSGTTQNLYAIGSNGMNLNVAVGANGTILTSADGTTWTAAANSATNRDLYAVNYSGLNGGTWLAVGAAGSMVKSTDGLTWSAVNSNSSVDLRAVSYGITSLTTGAGAYVAVGATGTILSSADGLSWTAQTVPGAPNLNAVTFGLQFVTVGAAGSVFTSTDGQNWTARTSGSSSELHAISRGALSYLVVGAGGSNLLSK